MTIQYLFNDAFISPYGGDYTIRIVDAPTYITFTSTIDGFTATKLLKGDSNPNAEYYKITIPAYSTYRKVQVYGYSFRTQSDDKVLLLDLYQSGFHEFKSVQQGSWDDTNTWYMKDSGTNSTWQPATYTPNRYNSVYINNAITLNGDVSCNNFNLKCDSGDPNPNLFVLDFKTNYNLNIYGFIKCYSGSIENMSVPNSNGSEAIIQSFLGTGGFTIVGKTRTFNFLGYVQAGGKVWGGSYYFRINLDTSSDVLNCGEYLIVGEKADFIKGQLNFTTGNKAIRSYRDVPRNGGDIYVRSGFKVMNMQDLNSAPSSPIRSLMIESGAIFEFDTVSGGRTKSVLTTNFSNSGTFIYSSTVAQNTITAGAFASVAENGIVTLTGAVIKTLNSDLTIKEKLSIGNITSITLNSKVIRYGTTGDLEITVSRTKGNEIPTNGSGVAIPRNLILGAGVTYNLGGAIVNIRGTLSLGAGASITNGTLNQNQL